MKVAAKILPLLFALLVLGPIGSRAQNATPASPIYGAYPQNYREIVTAWLNAALLDPKSVKVKWLGAPKPGELTVENNKKVAGYLVEFSVNARNVFGAYTGSQKHTALLRDGQVVSATGFVAR